MIAADGRCPFCGAECGRDEVHNGVAMLYGPWGCGACGWSESEAYDCRETWPARKRDGAGLIDPRGGWQRVASESAPALPDDFDAEDTGNGNPEDIDDSWRTRT